MSYNLKSLAAIANDQATTVKAKFRGSERLYTFKIPLSLQVSKQVSKGDYLVADTARGLALVQVAEVDDISDIDPSTGIEYRWAFAKVDTAVLDLLKKSEDEVVTKLTMSRRSAIRKIVMEAYATGDMTQIDRMISTGKVES